MRFKTVVSLICLVSLLVSIMVTGISCGGSKADGAAIRMMKKMPEGMDYFTYTDLATFRADDALQPALDDLLEGSEDVEAMLGIDMDDVKGIAVSGMGEEEDAELLTLFSGNFDLNKAREALEDLGCDKDTYRSVEVWDAFGYYTVALMTDLIIFGSPDYVNNCIDVIKDGDPSLYDDKDLADIVDRLPDGIMLGVGEGSWFLEDGDTDYEGLEVAATSASKGSEGKILNTGIFKFENKEAASAGIDEVEANAGDEEGVTNIKVSQDGESLEATFEQDIEKVFGD